MVAVNPNNEPLEKTTVRLEESLIETLDEAIRDAPDWLNLSRADLIRYGWGQDLSEWDESVRELVPDALLAKYRVKRMDERTQAAYYAVDKREGWRGRVKSRLNKRLAGEHPHHPDGVASLAEGYREELEYDHDLSPSSARSLEADLMWLEEQLSEYRDAWLAKTTVPDPRPFDDVADEVGVGRDLLQLRRELDDLVLELEDVAASEAYDPDAIVRALAATRGVSEDAISLVVDLLVPDDVDPRQALKGLEDGGLGAIVPEAALEETRVEGELSSERLDDRPPDRFDDATQPAQLRVSEEVAAEVLEADDPTRRTDVDVDEERLVEELDLDVDMVDEGGGGLADD